jgi:hypothetical protein
VRSQQNPSNQDEERLVLADSNFNEVRKINVEGYGDKSTWGIYNNTKISFQAIHCLVQHFDPKPLKDESIPSRRDTCNS